MRSAPRDSVTDTTIGSNSGVRPTASATANRNDSSHGRWNIALTSSTNSTSSTVSRMISMPKRRVPSLERGRRRLAVLMLSAMAPSAVAAAGAQTSMRALPLITEVPMNTALIAASRLSVAPAGGAPGVLFHRIRLAGQQRLLDEEIARFQHQAVGRHQVAGGQAARRRPAPVRRPAFATLAVAHHVARTDTDWRRLSSGRARRGTPARNRASR